MAPLRRDIVGAAVGTTITADILAGSTSISIASTTGWPTGSVGPFYVAIDPGLANEEKVLVLSRTGNTLTVVTTPSTGRGADNTTAAGHSSGAQIKVVGTATDLREANEHILDVEADPHATKLLNNARHDVTARHTVGTTIPSAAPSSTSLPSDGAAEGVAATVARSDHRHPREGFGSPTASAVGDVAADGAATTVARSNHKHAREAFGAVVAQLTAGLAAANGAAATVSRSDHVHGTPPAGAAIDYAEVTDIAASAVGDAAAAGVNDEIPRADHKHAREAFANPVAVGAANAAGSALTLPRSDHVHQDPLQGAWTAYTPTISGTGWALGNGTIAGRYKLVDKTLVVSIRYTLGGTGTVGTGALSISLPASLATLGSGSGGVIQIVAGRYSDSGAGSVTIHGFIAAGSTALIPYNTSESSGMNSTTQPSLSAGDQIYLQGVLEVA